MSTLALREGDTGLERRRRRRVRREVASPGATRTVAWSLAVVVVGSALCIGAVHASVMIVAAGALLAIYAIALWRGVVGRRLPGPAIGLALLSVLCLLQATPLPTALLGRIAKGNLEVWTGLLALLGERVPPALPVSLDPGASRLEAVRWSAYAVAFALSAALGALAGILIAPISFTSWDVGVMLGLKGFAAAMLGGLGSFPGAVLGGLLLGLAESLSVPLVG